MAKDTTVKEQDIELDLGQILGIIRDADNSQVEAQLNIARMLAAIKEYKLYEPKYNSFKMMVQCELDFAVHAAERYVSLYHKHIQFGYGREELLKLMRQLGWRKVQLCLRSATKKMGYRAMKAYLEEHYYSQDRQFNFNMRSDKTAQRLEKALQPFGLEVSEQGRRSHMTESLEALLDDYDRLKKRGEQMDLLEEDAAPTSTRKAKRRAPAKKKTAVAA